MRTTYPLTKVQTKKCSLKSVSYPPFIQYLGAVSTPIKKVKEKNEFKDEFYKQYYGHIRELQIEEDQKEESAVKLLHRMRMRSHLVLDQPMLKRQYMTPEKPWMFLQDLKSKKVEKVPLSCVKPILKKTSDKLYIHENIEWNMDKRFFRDPVVNYKVIKARKDHIRKTIDDYSQSKLFPICKI